MKTYKYIAKISLLIGFISLAACSSNNRVNKDKNSKNKIIQKLPKVCGFGVLYYGKVKYDKSSKNYYLNVLSKYGREYEIDKPVAPKFINKYVIFYGSPLVGGNRAIIGGEILQVVYNEQVNFNKLKAWCTLQPNSSEEPKAPLYRTFTNY